MDYTHIPSATDPAKVGPSIDPLFQCTEITNEAGDSDYPYYWTSTSVYFSLDNMAYYYVRYVAFGRSVDGNGEDLYSAGAVRFDTKV